MAKRKQDASWSMEREYTGRGYKSQMTFTNEEQLSQIQARIENIKNGSDDAFLEVCEKLSRNRDDTINALVARDTGSKHSKTPGGRSSADAIRGAASDEFDSGRQEAQERLLREASEEEERLKEEIANSKGAGVQMREKRKTRARMEADNVNIASNQNILTKLAELEGKVVLQREELDTDLDLIRSKGVGGSKVPRSAAAATIVAAATKPPSGSGKAAGPGGKSGPGRGAAAAVPPPALAAAVANATGKGPGRKLAGGGIRGRNKEEPVAPSGKAGKEVVAKGVGLARGSGIAKRAGGAGRGGGRGGGRWGNKREPSVEAGSGDDADEAGSDAKKEAEESGSPGGEEESKIEPDVEIKRGGRKGPRRDVSRPGEEEEELDDGAGKQKDAAPPPVAEKKCYSAKGIMYCGPLRVAKNEEVRVVFHVRPEGDGEEGGDATEAEAYPKDVVGKLSSVNSVEMRLVVEGEEALFKVPLSFLRTGRATVIKTADGKANEEEAGGEAAEGVKPKEGKKVKKESVKKEEVRKEEAKEAQAEDVEGNSA